MTLWGPLPGFPLQYEHCEPLTLTDVRAARVSFIKKTGEEPGCFLVSPEDRRALWEELHRSVHVWHPAQPLDESAAVPPNHLPFFVEGVAIMPAVVPRGTITWASER